MEDQSNRRVDENGIVWFTLSSNWVGTPTDYIIIDENQFEDLKAMGSENFELYDTEKNAARYWMDYPLCAKYRGKDGRDLNFYLKVKAKPDEPKKTWHNIELVKKESA